jgi:hypothetical protein
LNIKAAEVVVYDRLVPTVVLALIPKGTARIDVGKRSGYHPIPQDEINALLVASKGVARVLGELAGRGPGEPLDNAGIALFDLSAFVQRNRTVCTA